MRSSPLLVAAAGVLAATTACSSGDELLVAPLGAAGSEAASGGAAGASAGAAGTDELPAAVVFRDDQVLEYHVTMTEADREHLEERGDDEQYVPATLVVRGGEVGELALGPIGIRHKGSWPLHHCWDDFAGVRSHADECAKLSYKLDFAELVPDTRYFGLKKLNLHASSGDATKLRELLAYGMFRDFGVTTSRIAPAQVFVNGELEGLFFAVEAIDGRFTAFHFPEGGDGNLFKEVWPRADLPDAHFVAALQTNEETPDVSDIQAFSAAVGRATEASFAAELAPFVDLEALLRYVAVDRASKNWDGIASFYTPTSPHNFYWYHDDGPDGRFHLIPWDLDNTFWEFDPYMAPEQWVTADPIPDLNELPASCEPRPIWSPDSGEAITPPGCDPLLRLLLATGWERLVELGEELLAGPFTLPAMEAKLTEWEATLAPLVAEDPTLDPATWRAETEQLRATLARDIADFSAFLVEGYHDEPAAPALPEPDPAAFLAEVPETGLSLAGVNGYEFAGGAAGTAPVGVWSDGASGTTRLVTWNTTTPLTGRADLRFDFTFTRLPGAWDEWVSLWVMSEGNAELDLTAYRQISLTLRADRQREVRVRLESPAYADTFGGVWSEFGSDFAVGTAPVTVKLRLDRAYYPDWAREAWSAGQGWSTPDAEARAIVVARCSGLVFSPAPSTDAGGQLLEETETGYLEIDDVYFQ